jgi:hypothetical protein
VDVDQFLRKAATSEIILGSIQDKDLLLVLSVKKLLLKAAI